MGSSLSEKKSIVIGLMLVLGAVISACNLGDTARSVSVLGDELERICAQEELVVNTTEDTNDAVCDETSCSLREAVIQANACDSGQTIVLPGGVYELTRHGTDEDMARSGDLDITTSMTIRGEDGAIVDGQGAVRVFDARLDFGMELAFESFEIRNGSITGEGAGLRFYFGDLAMSDMTISGNHALSSGDRPGRGGGVFIQSGEVEVSQSVITQNEADGWGGGVFVTEHGVFRMDASSSLSSNAANSPEDSTGEREAGGGLYNLGEANISGIVQENRTNVGKGGGLFNSGILFINDAVLNANEVYRNRPGSALANAGSTEMRDVRVQNNLGGSAIDTEGSLRIEGGEIRDNHDTERSFGGEGDYLGSAIRGVGVINLIDVLIEDNADHGIVSGAGGPATWNLDSVTIRGHRGFAIASNDRVLIRDSVIEGNAGAVASPRILTIERTLIANNEVNESKIVGSHGRMELSNSTFSGNTAFDDPADAVIWASGEANLIHVTIANNELAAIRLGSETEDSAIGTLEIRGSILSENIGGNCTGAAITSSGDNLSDDVTCSLDESGDRSAIDPLLLPLADNGGPTRTHALRPESPAIDAIAEGCPPPTVDQRGESRPSGEGCDIGAFEWTEDDGVSDEAGGTPRSGDIDVNFNADRYTIEEGECTTLRWAVTGADTINLLGTEREATEAQQVCPDETTGYTLVAENAADQVQSFLEIEVTEPTFSGGDQSCLHQNPNENQPTCYEVCPVDDPNPGGTCTP